jgi:hypothetical protein
MGNRKKKIRAPRKFEKKIRAETFQFWENHKLK